jgi:hypothetical protein
MNWTPDATWIIGRPDGLAGSRHADQAPQDQVPDVRPDNEPEEGIDDRLLRELAERVRSERLRNDLQRSASQRFPAIGRQAHPWFADSFEEQIVSPCSILARDRGQ